MRIRTLTTRDAHEWRGLLAAQPLADVYHLPEYHAAAELNDQGEALCFVAEDSGESFLQPVMCRPIENGLTDLESVYGYSGPLATTVDLTFLEAAWTGYDLWCEERQVVAEFIRFNPLSRNETVAAGRYAVDFARDSVFVELTTDEEQLWKTYPPTQRNMVRRARREHFQTSQLERHDLADFERLYGETMERVGAARRYRFSSTYFEKLLEGPAVLFGVRDGAELVAAAMFLLYRDRMHYHLAGSSLAGRRAGATNLLLHEAAVWGARKGSSVLHLGGGLTADPRDPLLRFKRTISRLTVPARVGRRIHDAAAYERLCRAWLDRHGLVERPPFFLLWRHDG